ncbi:MAG TPA: class I SAM-dependent methyltransferase [Thermoanaerobaculia bacterium]|nr:class I SAM-dependent methyltransferase [Thermoanaerobaculia bacterium]
MRASYPGIPPVTSLPYAKGEMDIEKAENAAQELERRVREVCAAIVACEDAQLTRDEIAKILAPVRRVMVTAYDVRKLPRNAFDLVLAEGLLDALNDTSAVLLLQTIYRVLAPGGTFVFTTVAADDPHRPLFAHLGGAPLIARSEKELRRCCELAGISPRNVTLRREERGRALRIEVQKLD